MEEPVNKGRWVGGVLRLMGRALVPHPTRHPYPPLPTRTHSGKRLHAGRNGLSAWPLGAFQALGAKTSLRNWRSVEGVGVLHGKAGVLAQTGQEGSRWEHRPPSWRTG